MHHPARRSGVALFLCCNRGGVQQAFRTSLIPPTVVATGSNHSRGRRTGRTLSINGVSVNAPAFRAALADWLYLPQSPPATATALAAYRAAALRYGRCMRRHGIDIPDPKIEPGPGGQGIRRQIEIPPGMSQNSPAFVTADQKCERANRATRAAAPLSGRLTAPRLIGPARDPETHRHIGHRPRVGHGLWCSLRSARRGRPPALTQSPS